MELAPLEELKGGYKGAPTEYRAGDLAGRAYRLIGAKSDKYGSTNAAARLHLLTYCTDWRLSLPTEAQDLVALWLTRHPHAFLTVTYFEPQSAESGHLVTLYPRSDVREEDEPLLAHKSVIATDLSNFVSVSGAQPSAEVKLARLEPDGNSPLSFVFSHRLGPGGAIEIAGLRTTGFRRPALDTERADKKAPSDE